MIAAEMRAGSVAVFNGALLHQDADNESDAPRLGLEDCHSTWSEFRGSCHWNWR